MSKFRVRVTGIATVEATVEVEAETTEAAKEEALRQAKGGGVSWEYCGCEDDIEADEPEAA